MSRKLTVLWLLTLAVPAQAIETAPVTAIEFAVANHNLQQFGVKLSSQQIAERVSSNLAEWQYPLQAKQGSYSHQLQATLGVISHQSTPVGFSFSSGNSDPRAAEFQKADVLPITCRLSQGQQVIQEQQATFSSEQFKTGSSDKITDKLVDQISTTCFNLLEDLQLPQVTNSRQHTVFFKPGWMPDVRVEVQQVTNAATGVKAEQAESHKQVIIHNQGTPVILNFGHERK